MGAGMVAVLDPSAADAAIAALAARDIPAWVCGEVTANPGGTGHPRGHLREVGPRHRDHGTQERAEVSG